jgi:hypothetical protein
VQLDPGSAEPAAAAVSQGRGLLDLGEPEHAGVELPQDVLRAGEPATTEIIGVDTWMDADRMNEYYDLSLGFDHFGPVFAGAPETSVWRAAPGEWVEW